MKSIDNTVIRCSAEKLDNSESLNKDKYKLICKNCLLATPTGSKKLISNNPLILGDITVRESLINDWNRLIKTMNKIDFASIYIAPDLYHFCQGIRNSGLAHSIDVLTKSIKNTDLEAWSQSLFDFRDKSIELQNKINRISKKTNANN